MIDAAEQESQAAEAPTSLVRAKEPEKTDVGDLSESALSVQWGGMLFLLLLLISLLYSGWLVNQWLEDEQQMPVQRILLTGERQYLNEGAVIADLRDAHPGSFFTLDVEAVHQSLQAMPWVYSASVRKQWPNTLKIHVLEQAPAAYWNDDLLLNQYGQSFQAWLPESALPKLFGPGGSELTALQGYRAMQSLLTETSLHIVEMELSERFAWHVKLSDGVQLRLGRTEFIDRFQRFVDVYPLLQKADKKVSYIDLRYDTGMAVGWQASQTS